MLYNAAPQGLIDTRHQLLAVQISLVGLAALVVALRLFTRFFILKSPGWDDLAISIGLVSLLKKTSCFDRLLNLER